MLQVPENKNVNVLNNNDVKASFAHFSAFCGKKKV